MQEDNYRTGRQTRLELWIGIVLFVLLLGLPVLMGGKGSAPMGDSRGLRIGAGMAAAVFFVYTLVSLIELLMQFGSAMMMYQMLIPWAAILKVVLSILAVGFFYLLARCGSVLPSSVSLIRMRRESLSFCVAKTTLTWLLRDRSTVIFLVTCFIEIPFSIVSRRRRCNGGLPHRLSPRSDEDVPQNVPSPQGPQRCKKLSVLNSHSIIIQPQGFVNPTK
jgi:hypothetical protein